MTKETCSIPIVYSDFGLGPFGKALSILQNAPIWASPKLLAASEVEAYFLKSELDKTQYSIVVLDPASCQQMKEEGIKCVYVDSLPFLWEKDDPIAWDADIYCAQMTDVLPDKCWAALRSVQNLKWISPIVPTSQIKTGSVSEGTCAIHFGGVVSPISGWNNYIDLLFPQICDVLSKSHIHTVNFYCSEKAAAYINAKHSMSLQLLTRRSLKSSVLFEDRSTMMAFCSNAERVFTSPGLTFMLECSALNVPIILLPPQNLSQIFNARKFARFTQEASMISWPKQLADKMDQVISLSLSEFDKVSRLYRIMGEPGLYESAGVNLNESFHFAIKQGADPGSVFGFCPAFGKNGAREVWEHVDVLRSKHTL